MNSSKNAMPSRFVHIDALRAMSVLLVVVAHAGLGDIIPGGSGVTIFFCISGFVITNLVLKEKTDKGGFEIGWFYFRRFMKIVPPLMVIVIIPTLTLSAWIQLDWSHFASQLLFTFNWTYMRGSSQILPGSGVVWSLSIEEQFYLVFALMWLLLAKLRKADLYLSLIAVSTVLYSNLARVYFANGENAHSRVYYGSDTRVDAIAIGVLGAIWLSKRGSKNLNQSKSKYQDLILIIACLAFIFSLIYRDEWFRNTFRFTIQSGASVVFILYGFIAKNTLMNRIQKRISNLKVVRIIGLASYSIYLCHLSLDYIVHPWLLETPFWVSVSTKTAAGVVLGIIIYFCVEVPSLKQRYKIQNKFKNHA